jgi:PAS domain S-box-containing protein
MTRNVDARSARGAVARHRSGSLGPEAYRALYDNSPDGVLFTVPDGHVLAANRTACQILGRSEADICALGRQGLADPADGRWVPILAERERSGQVHGVARMLRGDGAAIEVEISAQIFHERGGEERSCTIIRDVTERVAMERALRESRARLAEAERVAQTGSWEWDVAADRVSWSDGLLDIYGLTADEFDSTRAGGDRRVYPEDRERVREEIERALEQSSAFTIEYRAVRADGRLRTLRSRGEVVVDDVGEPVRLVGIVQDVTEARLAHETLRGASSELERRASELQRLALGDGPQPGARSHAPLTSRQLEILRLIAEGLTSGQIAQRLFVTEATVKWHVKQILAKTASSNRAEAVARVLGASQERTGT